MNLKSYSNQAVQFLKENPAISLEAIERQSGIANGTLCNVIKGRRGVPKKHLFSLLKELVKLGLRLDGFNCQVIDGQIIGSKTLKTVKVHLDKDEPVYTVEEARITLNETLT